MVRSKFIVFLLLVLLNNINIFAHEQTVQNVLDIFDEENIQFVRYEFVDILGNPRSYTVTRQMAESTLKDGINVDGSSLIGFTAITSSDLLIKPDLSTLRIVPWDNARSKTAQFIGDVCTEDGHPLPQDPRTLLKQACAQLNNRGYSLLASCELEFFLIKQLEKTSTQTKTTITTDQLDSSNYCEHSDRYSTYPIMLDILNALRLMELEPEKTHHEVASGQHEITLKCADALTTADNIVTTKNVIRFIANHYGYDAVFMPKPILGQNGSGLHTNYSLFDLTKKTNAFYQQDDPIRLSSIARQFIAGNLLHIKEMTALFNPIVNSYKRLVVGYEAPVYIAWGVKNRSTLIRIPGILPQNTHHMRAELRSPDPSCNPYLALAALIYSGLDGIDSKLELMPATDKNLFTISAAERALAGIDALPGSLETALDYFETSDFIKQSFGEQFQKIYSFIKHAEVDEFKRTVTDWELNRYRSI